VRACLQPFGSLVTCGFAGGEFATVTLETGAEARLSSFVAGATIGFGAIGRAF
jgi:hypothetical protein